MVWKAKSHAAYHGYSHLSGIEMMCWFTMWNHSLFRMKRPPGFIGSTPCSVSHMSTSKKKNCFDQSIPPSAWRMTRASSSLTLVGVMDL